MRRIIASILVLAMLGTASCSAGTIETSESVPHESTTFVWNDSPGCTLIRYVDTEGEDMSEIPLKGYKSGTDPVILNLDKAYDYYGDGSKFRDFAESLPSKITDEPLLNITKDLDLASKIDGIQISWRSSDESVLGSDGKVRRPHDRSVYVILEAHFDKDGSGMTARYVVRVARDMYDDTDPDKLEVLAHDGRYHEPPPGTEGEWFVFDTMNQITRFDPQADVMVDDKSHDCIRSFLISGRISMPRIDSEKEAYLCIVTLGKILSISHRIRQFEFKTAETDMGDTRYDYCQTFKGVPVLGGTIRVTSSFRRPFTSVVVETVMIPDDFDATPKVSMEEAESANGINSSRLVIMEWKGSPRLVYQGYAIRKPELIFIDANTGELLRRESLIIE